MKQKTNRLHFSTRTVAMILSVIMLIGSIATGSMLSTFAAYLQDAAQSDAVTQAASEGSDIALNAIPSDEDSADDDEDAKEAPDLSRLRENSIVKRLKQDLTATGAKADLAKIGDGDTYYMHIGVNGNFKTDAPVEFTYDSTNSLYYASYTLTKNNEYPMVINTNSGSLDDGDKSSSSQTVTSLASAYNPDSIQFDYFEYKSNNYDGYDCFKFKTQTSQTVYFTFASGTSTLIVRSSLPGGGTTPTVAPTEDGGGLTTESKGNIPTRVLAGTDVMIYIQSYNGTAVDLCDNNSAPSAPPSNASNKDDTTANKTFYSSTNIIDGTNYVQVTKTSLSTYNRITNNLSNNWNGQGNQSTNISAVKDTNGGQLFYDKGDNGNAGATTCTTTIAPLSIEQGDTVTFTTTCGGTTMSYADHDLYYQYYLDDSTTPIAVASGKDSIKGSTSAQNFILSSASTSALSAGTHTLKTVATDGKVFYISDTDTFTVTVEAKHAVTTSVSPSGWGSISIPNGYEVGEVTSTTIKANPIQGYEFSSWEFGTGITGASTTANPTTITTKASGLYTVQANFARKDYTVTYTPTTMATDHGTYTVTNTTDSTAVASGDSLPYLTGLTVTCTPDTGYTVDYVKVNNSDSGVTYDGNTAVFTVPAADAEITVAFKKSDLSISKSTSPAGKGTITVSKTSGGSNTTTYQVGDTLYLSTSVSDNAYTVNSYTLTYGDGTKATISGATGNTGAIDATHFGTDGSISIIANLTKKPTYKVTVKTSKLSYGSATASVSEAYQGQSVTITATENSGTFTKWTVTSGTVSSVDNITTNPLTFTMGSTDLVITANFVEYSAQSNFYYNNYGSNGQPAATHYGGRMTEAKLNGETYSYYHVTDRTEADQLFTVSYGSPKYNNYYTYFEMNKDWSGLPQAQFYATDGKNLGDWADMSWYEDSTETKKFRIWTPDGARSVKFKHGSDTTPEVFYHVNGASANGWIAYNDMATLTSFANYNPVPNNFWENFNSGKYTNAFNSGGFSNYNANRGESHSYTKPTGLGSNSGDYYILVLYENKTYTINGVTKTISNDPEIIWLPTLPTSVVADDTPTVDIYAKNGTLRDSTFNRFTNLADTDFDLEYFEYTETLDSGVYTYRSIDEYNNSGLHTSITYNNNVSGYNSNYALMSNVPVGAKIKIKTTLSNDSTVAGSFPDAEGNAQAFRDSHYMKGYSFNGATYQVNEWNNTGVYEEIWTVRDVNTKKTVEGVTENLTKDGKTIEVTPIYYMKDNSNCKTFYIDGYDGTVQGQWGNMLSVYPYYEGKSNAANAFGGYPGQPMLFWGGKYQMEIPLTVDGTSTGATVKGLTLHNSYWDLLHRSLDLKCNAKNHAQTYDYDDFYKLYKEKNPDTIIFDFKYQNTTDNLDQGYGYTNYTFGGASKLASADDIYTPELVTDYFGRQVDVFGTLIAQDKLSDYKTSGTQDSELLLVSTGYKDTYVGEYATIWAVYAPASGAKNGESEGQFIGYISSSMLYLNSIDRVSQYTDGTNTAAGRMSWGDSSNKGFVYTYNYLKEYYKGVPALISYERELWNDSKDKAYRSDGKWYYSNKNDQITANILVQYCDTAANVVNKEDKALNDDVWTTDTFANSGDDYKGLGGEYNVGTHSNCSAYFTNTTPYLKGKTDSGKQFADSTKKFTFEAVASGSYLFVNWVRYSNGRYYEVSESELAESPMSSNDTYIARFVKSSNGTLKISHVVEQNGTYTGTGTPSVTVTVSNASDVQQFTQTSTDGTPIDITNFMKTKYSGYKINISLSTVPDEDCVLHDITNGSGIAKYNPGELTSNAATVAVFTVEDALEGDYSVTNLRYVSHLTTTTYTYNYKIRYTYTSRFWGKQYYDVTGSLSSSNPEDMALIEGKKGTAKLTTDFIIDKTPYEKNFRQMINWNYTYDTVGDAAAMTNAVTGNSGTTYTIDATVNSSNVINDKVKAEILLPYPHNDKSSDYSAKTVVAHHSANDDSTTYDEYIFDESQEAVSIEAQAYKLFTTDGSVPDNMTNPDDTRPMNIPHLVHAAEYVWKNPAARYVDESATRYFTGFNFTLDGITYYCDLDPNKPEVPDETQVILTAADTQVWQGNTYTYAVEATVDGKREVYTFMNYITDGVFNGGYNRYYINHQLDGFYMYDEYGELTGEKKYFTRWDIFSSDGTYVASSYNRYFNYSGYQNYLVKAIYDSDTPGSAVESPVSSIPTIVYLGDTRNQWTAGGQGSAGSTYSNASSGGDKLIHDFAISYDYYPEEIRTVTDKNIKIGMFIEQIGALEVDGSGDKIIDTSYYADKYKGTFDANAIKGYFEGTVTAEDLKTTLSARNLVNSKIASTDGSWGKKFTDTDGDIGNNHSGLQPIDNMNRLQWAYTFTNTKTEGTIGETNNANFVYRASAYIIINGTATVSSTPVYFTLYDSAHR